MKQGKKERRGREGQVLKKKGDKESEERGRPAMEWRSNGGEEEETERERRREINLNGKIH